MPATTRPTHHSLQGGKQLEAVIASAPETTAPVTRGANRITVTGQGELIIENLGKTHQALYPHTWWLRPTPARVEPAELDVRVVELGAGEQKTVHVKDYEAGAVLIVQISRSGDSVEGDASMVCHCRGVWRWKYDASDGRCAGVADDVHGR